MSSSMDSPRQATDVSALAPTRRAASGWPIKPSIASVVVGGMVVMASLLIYVGWVGARESMLFAAAESARDAGRLITEQSHRMLEPVKATLPILAGTPLAKANSLAQRLDNLGVLVDTLNTSSLVSAVYAGYSDGSFILVRPVEGAAATTRFKAPPRTRYLVQSLSKGSDDTSRGEFLFFDAALALIELRAMPDYQYDPRSRPWFQATGTKTRSYASDPYVFFTTQQVGITLSYASSDRSMVVGVDVVLDDLAERMKALRMTPGTELALVDNSGKVLVYTDMRRALIKTDAKIDFQHIEALGARSLAQLSALKPELGKVQRYDENNTEWLGLALPFDAWQSDRVRLLVAAPVDDFLMEIKSKGRRLILLIIGLALLLVPFGWHAGATVGKSLDKLTEKAHRMGRFDFSRSHVASTLVQEVNTLSDVLSEMGNTIQAFLQISQDMATEPKVERMLDNVLNQMVTATRCSAGAVYLCGPDAMKLVQTAYRGDFIDSIDPLRGQMGNQNPPMVQREIAPGLGDMQIELRSRKGVLQGLLVLQYPLDRGHADPAFTVFAQKLSGVLSISIETRQLFDQQKRVLDGFIRLMAYAIDAKSPYTGSHCERVPVLAGMLVDRIVSEMEGPYADFTMTEEERYEFHLGAWLHDCGKVTSPEHIIDKATKLEAIYNRIHEVRMRFEVLWRDAEIDCLKGIAAGGDPVALGETRDARRQALKDDFEFTAKCNVGGESMAETDVDRLRSIANQIWERNFDNRLGLSVEENRRMAEFPSVALPVQERLLADMPEHVVPWGERRPAVEKGHPNNAHGFDMVLPKDMQNLGEIYNLSIGKGTLTAEDRFTVNDHIVQTLVMLRSLPWPAHLAKVPDIAATHHEKMDGMGYPRRLTSDKLTLVDRVMAMADIFEALTSADRPYKTPKTLTESLRIMAHMAKNQHIDAELFRYFLRSNLWHEFARKFVHSDQIDSVDVAAIESLIPQPSGA
jgi:HD-GYP domain-containing protein (c-di-GMP phosphodiesterase class II)